MHYTTEDKQTLQLLQSIEKRLALANPTFDELPKDTQRAIFMRAVEATPLSEIYEIEMTNEVCIARREAIERAKEQERLARAKSTGVSDFDEAVNRISKQVPQSVK